MQRTRISLALVLFLPFVACVHAFAQKRIVIKLDSFPARQGGYFLAGNINGWNPADSNYLFRGDSLVIDSFTGSSLEFKITRGSWPAVETTTNGNDISNRLISPGADTTVWIAVKGWKDDFQPQAKRHTASANVSILDTAFYIPELGRTRTVRLYLPPSYEQSKRHYPVLYMLDGQNCFDESTSGFGEWHIDEALDHYFDSCGKSMIVVAVDNDGDHRLQEYNPYDFEKTGKGEGKQFAKFLAITLKPFVDSMFRTKPGKRNNYIAGSSMGAVIAMYSVLTYPDVFGTGGIFSPAFWTAAPLYELAKRKLDKMSGRSFFMYAGGKESKTMVADTKKMYRILANNKLVRLRMIIDEAGAHNEAAWSKWFPSYLRFLLR